MTRPSFVDIYDSMASLVAKRSTCRRLSVGAVITSDDYRYVYGLGYNGNAAGLPNDCDSSEPGKCGCVHAEVNAVVNCTVSRTVPKIVFCTDLPCANCAKVLINLGGVQQIYYSRDYRLKDSLALFKRVGIKIDMLQPLLVRVQDRLKCLSSRSPGGCHATVDANGEWNGWAFDFHCPEHGEFHVPVPSQGMADHFTSPTVLEAAGLSRIKATEFGGRGRENRFAYTRGDDGFINGCIARSDRRDMPSCTVCKGDCPDKERFATAVKGESPIDIAAKIRTMVPSSVLEQWPAKGIDTLRKCAEELEEMGPQKKLETFGGAGVYDHYKDGVYTALFVATYVWFQTPMPVAWLTYCRHHETREAMSLLQMADGLAITHLARSSGAKEIPEGTPFVIYVSHETGAIMARPLFWDGDDSWNDIVTWKGAHEGYTVDKEKPRFIRRREEEQPK